MDHDKAIYVSPNASAWWIRDAWYHIAVLVVHYGISNTIVLEIP